MKRLVFAVSLLIAGVGSALASPLSVSEKTALQAAMFQHIDQQLVDGKFLWLDTREGKVTGLVPAKAHPKIFRLGDHFVLCVDFRDPSGKDVNVDFFTARSGDTFTVFHTEIENRDAVKGLMKAGKVTPAM